MQIYRLLAQGRPVEKQQLADKLQIAAETIDDMLDRWWGIHYDQQRRIIAYWGLSIHPTQNCFKVGDRQLYTWCSWDTLFLPEILQESASVESLCATTGSRIHLTMSPDRVEYVQPEDTVMSFMIPAPAGVKKSVVAHFCHAVHFFSSKQAGLRWTGQHAGTFLLTVEQAHRLGQKINALQYPDIQISAVQ